MNDGSEESEFLAAVRRVDPADFARLVAATPDELLREAMRTQLGPLILDEVFRRFPWFFKPERARGNYGIVEWVVTGAGGEPARYLVRIKNVECWVERESAEPVRTTLELDAADCVRLVTGQASQPILLLSGRLRVSGDERFAIQQAGFFSLPTPTGKERRADVRAGLGAMDVGEVARAVADTPDDRLREAIRGPFRELLLEELFRRLPEYFDSERADGVTGTLDWRITDAEVVDRYLVVIADGVCRVRTEAGPGPRAKLTLGAVDLLKLTTGNANPIGMVLRRRLRLGGDLLLASRLPSLFRIPSPA